MNMKRTLTVGSLKKDANIVSHNAPKKDKSSTEESKKEPQNVNQQQVIKVIQNNEEYNITPTIEKRSLLDTALEQDQQLSFKCKKGTCGKCTVKVVEGSGCLEALTNSEKEKLKGNTDLGYRLACQALVKCN
ncbi:2Fe-2S iron-sulfur cluster-binding protein [Anaerobacillus sp. MEB173]|uniref:2Fe-2S iron-sulfur cluster-binding protein n=1 Tax=Anaerobacillus sp. MEB173 TaxID=3383345 RepID=UPI003F932E6E